MTKLCQLKYLLFAFTVMGLMGCGKAESVRQNAEVEEPDKDAVLRSLTLPERKIDPQLAPFLEEFRAVLGHKTLNEKNELVSLSFRNLPSGYAGYCVTKQLRRPANQPLEGYVVIDEKLSDLQLKAVIWHELGHCLFNLKHTTQPGIMNEYIPSDAILAVRWSSMELDYLQLIEKDQPLPSDQFISSMDDHIGFTSHPGRLEIQSTTLLPFR